ncbi:MFS transporter [Streptomyces sp. NPDC002888]|uniref:MFS transporter n=1 Tax=Streptomyces sp. NPDC002888 TaxID=3364668 RepID=UPI00369F8022
MSAAVNLRPAVTGVGPVLEEARAGLGMSATLAGLLTSMPAVCFALVGFTAPRLARRHGPDAVVVAGMAAVTAGLALRPLAPNAALFVTLSILALAGIAVANVLLPVVVKERFPERVGAMTGFYSMALNVGASTAAAVTVPLAQAFGGDWRMGLGAWALLAAVAVPPWLVLARDRAKAAHRASGKTTPSDATVARAPTPASATAPRREAPSDVTASHAPPGPPRSRPSVSGATEEPSPPLPLTRDPTAGADATAPRQEAPSEVTASHVPPGLPRSRPSVSGVTDEPSPPLPLTRDPTAWALAVYFGLQATAAYVVIGWLPQIFRDAGLSAEKAGVLFAVTSVLGIPLSLALAAVAGRLRDQSAVAVTIGLFGLAGYAGLWAAPAAAPWLWAVLLGVANCSFPLALTMIGMRGRDGATVIRLSAFAQSTGYLLSIPGPVLVGALYQHTGGWHAPLLLLSALMPVQLVAGLLAGRDRPVG